LLEKTPNNVISLLVVLIVIVEIEVNNRNSRIKEAVGVLKKVFNDKGTVGIS